MIGRGRSCTGIAPPMPFTNCCTRTMNAPRNHFFRLVRARRAFVVFDAVAIFCCHLCLLDTFPLPA